MPLTSAQRKGRTEKVVVRLSEIPVELRVDMAHRAAKRWGLTGYPYMELLLVAQSASPDAQLEVDAEKARLVLEKGKAPTGPIPVW